MWATRQTRIYRRLLLGLAALAFFAAARPAHAQIPTYTESTLYTFTGDDGYDPWSGLIQATDGNFYGTTSQDGSGGAGTVFKLTPDGVFTTLYGFCSLDGCRDGGPPYDGLVQGTDGNFYGTTYQGGAYGNYGTVFKITPAGALLTLYSFCGQLDCTDGYNPEAGLVQGADGNFYGTTYSGGKLGTGVGTIFKITPAGALTTLYVFQGAGGSFYGENPDTTLVKATNGNIYGIADSGVDNSDGTVFQITPAGAVSEFYGFCGGTGSECPGGSFSALMQGTDGNFYGTAASGGANGYGMVFSLSLSGTLTDLYDFCSLSNCSDGSDPTGGVIQGTDGNFYGTTIGGGAQNYGTVFKLTPSGTLTTIYNFCSQGGSAECTDGYYPRTGVIQGKDGNFYGMTSDLVFKLVPSVNLNATTSILATPNPVDRGQTVTLTAGVTGTQGTPTGTVTFSADGTSLGTQTLNSSGTATMTVNTAAYALGTYSLLAVYSGNSTYKGSQSTADDLVIQKAASSVTLTASPNPAQPGQTVTLSVMVIGEDGDPTGTVNFTVNGTSIGSKTLTSGNGDGVATLTVSTASLPAGTYPVIATYSGNSDYNGSQSPVEDVVLAVPQKDATNTTVSGAPNPVTPPASITLIAIVERTLVNGVPSGTVTFYYGTESLGTVTLDESGEASLTAPTTGLAAGTYPITVKYNGGANDLTSTSAPLNVTVN